MDAHEPRRVVQHPIIFDRVQFTMELGEKDALHQQNVPDLGELG